MENDYWPSQFLGMEHGNEILSSLDRTLAKEYLKGEYPGVLFVQLLDNTVILVLLDKNGCLKVCNRKSLEYAYSLRTKDFHREYNKKLATKWLSDNGFLCAGKYSLPIVCLNSKIADALNPTRDYIYDKKIYINPKAIVDFSMPIKLQTDISNPFYTKKISCIDIDSKTRSIIMFSISEELINYVASEIAYNTVFKITTRFDQNISNFVSLILLNQELKDIYLIYYEGYVSSGYIALKKKEETKK